ncbi:MAG: S-layer homology domain-containing protein [Clostridia bacterium]|nr:S-layer homology domain-containing protein [Clostridia bacterium]
MLFVTRKIITAIVSCVLLATSVITPAFATDSKGLGEAIVTIRTKLDIPKELTEFDSNINRSEESSSYYVRWFDKDETMWVNATANSFGDVTSYSIYREEYDRYTPRFPKFNYEQQTETAKKWIERVNPHWLSELVLNTDYERAEVNIYSDNTTITFDRYVNGIKFLYDGVSVRVSNSDGTVKEMYSTWTYNKDIPGPDGIIDEEAAGEKFFEISPLKLEYMTFDDKNAQLVYTPENPYLKIDAKSGKQVQLERVYADKEAMEEEAPSASLNSAGGGGNRYDFTDSELKNLEEIENLIPQEKLIELARGIENTGLDSASFKSCSYVRARSYKDEEEKALYNAELTFAMNADQKNEYLAYITFDAQTGELKSFYSYDYTRYNEKKEDEELIDSSAALETAKSFLDKNAGDMASAVKAPNSTDIRGINTYTVDFIRYQNDIPFPRNYVCVEIDGRSGKVSRYQPVWDEDIIFQDPDNIMEIKAAEEKFMENIGMEKAYINSYPIENNSNQPVIALAYGLYTNKGTVIDGKSGEVLNSYEKKEKVIPTDISGHYAEEQIKALISSGVVECGEDAVFSPDEGITLRELVAMVSKITYRNQIWDISAIESFARNNNLIKGDEAFQADKPATRADGPVYIIRLLGYGEVAELSHIFNQDFSDADMISEDIAGYVAIAKGLGIIKGDENGNFNGGESLTRADAAIMIYNYLAR